MKLVFLGAPGVGKGTYASRIGPLLGIPQISTGDLVTNEIKNKTPLGEKIKEYNDRGLLVPDEIITDMLKERLRQGDTGKGFILDGFPRTLKQAELLEKITEIDMVININLREDILIEKLSGRRICRGCGEIYNIADINRGSIRMPPILPKRPGICDKCGGEIYQRDDDRESVIKERLEVYRKQTEPLIEYYRTKGLLKDFFVTGGPDEMVPRLIELIKSKQA
jgi:adenylate kinase